MFCQLLYSDLYLLHLLFQLI